MKKHQNISKVTGEIMGPLNRASMDYHLPGHSRIVRISKKNMTRLMRVNNPPARFGKNPKRRREGMLARV